MLPASAGMRCQWLRPGPTPACNFLSASPSCPLLLPPPFRLAELGLAPSLLDTQYRMHPAIAQFPAAWFYAGRLKDGVTAQQKPPPAGLAWPVPGWPVAVVEVSWEAGLEWGDGRLCCSALFLRCCTGSLHAEASSYGLPVCKDVLYWHAGCC